MGSYINTFSPQYPTYQQNSSLSFPSMFKIPQKPTCFLTKITSSSSPQKGITRWVSEKIVILVVGSLVFTGGFSKKPVLSQVAHQRESGEVDEEEMMHMKLLEDNPTSVEAVKSAFFVKMKRGKTKEAIGYVERLIGVEPEEVEWRLLQAECYKRIGEYSKAKTLFKEILKERPLLIRALHGLAVVMQENGEGAGVFEMLNEALEMAGQKKKVRVERSVRILMAQMHVVQGEMDEGLRVLKDLIQENPRDFRPYLCQGMIYSLLGRMEEAEQEFSTYRSLVPDEFPEKGFLDDVILAAKTQIRPTPKHNGLNKSK